jgi:hypothetical protein
MEFLENEAQAHIIEEMSEEYLLNEKEFIKKEVELKNAIKKKDF